MIVKMGYTNITLKKEDVNLHPQQFSRIDFNYTSLSKDERYSFSKTDQVSLREAAPATPASLHEVDFSLFLTETILHFSGCRLSNGTPSEAKLTP